MKIALVHDYIYEFGGAERVLLALSEIWPDAPIYTAFYEKNSSAFARFKNKDIRVSWFHKLPWHTKLASPLRFLAPVIWNSFDFSDYDVVITSANWYITKGIKKGKEAIEICYCHTPPRYLYGYKTSVEWKRFWPVRIYGTLVGHFLKLYDFKAAQRVDYFIANSLNVARRIEKFYRRDSRVIYPPVEVSTRYAPERKRGYYLVVSRLVGGKGLELAVRAANLLGINLKVVGVSAGWGGAGKKLRKLAGDAVEFLGEVSDEDLSGLYAGAKGFLATAEDEDFGITPVEAMGNGTPVIAFKGGGYRESVVEGETGTFFNELTVESLTEALIRMEKIKISADACRKQAKKFAKVRFKKEMVEFVKECAEK